MKELAEDANREMALKEVANATVKEKSKATEVAEKKAQSSEKAQRLTKEKLAKAEEKLGGVKLKFAKAASLNLAQADEIVDLKATLKACESKWYDEGFADAERFAEPIIHQARSHGFGKGWLVALQAMEVPKDSPLRNLEQIPYSAPPPPVRSQTNATDEEDTPSMRELVKVIDAHVDLKVTSQANIAEVVQS